MPRRRGSLGPSAHPFPEEEAGAGEARPRPLPRLISIEEDPLPQLLERGSEQPLSSCQEEEEEEGPHREEEGPTPQAPPSQRGHTPASPRGQPVGKEALRQVRAPVSLLRCHAEAARAVGRRWPRGSAHVCLARNHRPLRS